MNPGRIPQPRTGLAAGMRAEFDATFSRPPRPARIELEDVLALRLGQEQCFVRLSEIAGVIVHPVLTAVPTPAAALIGVASHHGSLLAAYDLAVLLDRAPTSPRWMVIPATEPSIGVTFEHFEGYQQLAGHLTESVLLVHMNTVVDRIRALNQSPPIRAQNRSGD